MPDIKISLWWLPYDGTWLIGGAVVVGIRDVWRNRIGGILGLCDS